MLASNSLSKDGYIINQSKLNTIPYGKYTSDYNGCGWIATYNAMKLLGEKVDVENIIDYLNHYTIIKGKLGTNPAGIKNFFKERSFSLKSTSHVEKFNSYSKNCGAGIILYLSNQTAHYVAFNKSGEQYHFYNDIYGKEDDIRTMDQFLKEVKFNIAYLIAIYR